MKITYNPSTKTASFSNDTSLNIKKTPPRSAAEKAKDGGTKRVPLNFVAPVIAGTPSIGQTLTLTIGTWTHNPTSFSYQWLADNIAISAATQLTYIIQAGDSGKIITANVTGSNVDGQFTALSNSIGPVTAAAPVNTVAPAITGTTITGQTLTVTNGTWTGSPTFARQWKADGANIGGATGLTYVLTAGEVGKNITVTVTATNGGGSTPINSNSVGPVTLAVPTNTVAPAITGSTVTGQTLTVSNGTWTGSPTYTRQWKANGTNIGGATATTYVLTATEETKTITVTVTATNAGGSTPITTAGVGPVTAT